MRILRHDKKYIIVSDLDPIEDLLNFISAMRSKGFTSDLLKEKHGFSSASEIKITAEIISYHIDNAIGLANQGLDGQAEISFLPLYYATLNLAKVYLLLLGKRNDLGNNRWHGAKYFENEMRKKFLNEKIKIYNKGTIPLFYNTISGKTIGKNGYKLKLHELYSNISSISAEYETMAKSRSGYMLHTATVIEDDKNGHYLKVEIEDIEFSKNPPLPKQLKAFSGLRLIKPANGDPYYETQKQKGKFNNVQELLKKKIKRHLNSDDTSNEDDTWNSYTPVNGRNHVFNEELSIMLAYFHLSNVVRYNPEHLYRLMDSRYWAMLLGLRKHGFLRFLKLMWGNYNKTCFGIE